MSLTKPVGRGAAARKYDILSALMAFSLAEHKAVQRRALRLMSLVTTRYNWAADELRMGQRQIATLWSVDERTVKREMARLRECGWLVLKSQGARGRVSIYGLGIEKILFDTRSAWNKIGSDFVMRMNPDHVETTTSNVVPIKRGSPSQNRETKWGRALEQLREIDPATCTNWFEPLTEVGIEELRMVLMAPTKFHARFVEGNHKALLFAAIKEQDPQITDIRVIF